MVFIASLMLMLKPSLPSWMKMVGLAGSKIAENLVLGLRYWSIRVPWSVRKSIPSMSMFITKPISIGSFWMAWMNLSLVLVLLFMVGPLLLVVGLGLLV